MTLERTLLIIKPDGARRNLIGKILDVFERAELELIYLQMTQATAEQVLEHYADDPEWLETAGGRAIQTLQTNDLDPLAVTGVASPREVGGLIRQRLVEYITSGPVVIAVLEGNSAVAKVRQLVGATLPQQADPGSIRGRYCSDDVVASFMGTRALQNLVHASGSSDEFEREVKVWIDGTLIPAWEQ